jgi:hypothetical protein
MENRQNPSGESPRRRDFSKKDYQAAVHWSRSSENIRAHPLSVVEFHFLIPRIPPKVPDTLPYNPALSRPLKISRKIPWTDVLTSSPHSSYR